MLDTAHASLAVACLLTGGCADSGVGRLGQAGERLAGTLRYS